MNWIGDHLDSYFRRTRYAVYTALVLRTIFTAWVSTQLIHRLKTIILSQRHITG